MAAYIQIISNEKGNFSASDIIGLAGEMKRRNVPRTTEAQVLMHVTGKKLEIRVPLNGYRKVAAPPVSPAPTKTPVRGAKRKKK